VKKFIVVLLAASSLWGCTSTAPRPEGVDSPNSACVIADNTKRKLVKGETRLWIHEIDGRLKDEPTQFVHVPKPHCMPPGYHTLRLGAYADFGAAVEDVGFDLAAGGNYRLEAISYGFGFQIRLIDTTSEPEALVSYVNLDATRGAPIPIGPSIYVPVK
jgi:hypothetical protein